MNKLDDKSSEPVSLSELFESAAKGYADFPLMKELDDKVKGFLEGLQKEQLIARFGNTEKDLGQGEEVTPIPIYALFVRVPKTIQQHCVGMIKTAADTRKSFSLQFVDSILFYSHERLLERSALSTGFNASSEKVASAEVEKFFIAVKAALKIIKDSPGIAMMQTPKLN